MKVQGDLFVCSSKPLRYKVLAGEYVIITCAFLILSLFVGAQKLSVKFYELNNRNGLSQNSVYEVLQDSKGFIWVATEFGLNKYDGYQFTTYLSDPDAPRSLSNSFLNTLFEDSKGNLWIGTNGSGISKFNKTTETFVNYSAPAAVDSFFKNNSVWSIAEENESLWLGTFGGGLKQFIPETGEWNTHKLPSNDIRCLVPDGSGKIWVGTFGTGIYRFDPNNGDAEHFRLTNSLEKSLKVLCLLDEDSILWVGTQDNGLFMLNKNNRSVINYRNKTGDRNSLSGNFIRSIVADPHDANSYWVGIWGEGLCRLNRATQSILRFSKKPTGEPSFPDKEVLNLYVDNSGLIWCGTYKSGLVRFRSNGEKFETMYCNLQAEGPINGLLYNASGLWLANSFNGLQRCNENEFELVMPAKQSLDGLYFVMAENDSILWMGTLGNGLIRFEINSKRYQSFQSDESDPNSLSLNSVYSGLKDSEGRLWFGTYGEGLNQYDSYTGNFIHYKNDPEDTNSLSDNSVMVLFEDSKKNIWVGTGTGGLNRFDPIAEKFYRLQSKNAPGPTTSITSIQEDGQGQIWVGSTSGLFRIEHNGNNSRYVKYTSKDGLPSDRIYGLLIDSKDTKWLSTTKGICKFSNSYTSEDSIEVELFDKFNGVSLKEFSIGSYYKDKDGVFYFGGIGGFVKFHPDSIYFNDKPPRLAFTNLKIMNKPVLIDSISDGSNGVELRGGKYYMPSSISLMDHLKLSYNERVITIEFAALDFNHSEKNQYYHKLEGFDQEWVSDKNKRRVTYTNLPAGSYSLMVKGSNDRGVWSSDNLVLGLTITPPFWKTWWFILGVSSFLIGMIVVYIKSRFNRIKREKVVLEQKVDERTAEINAQRLEIEQKATELFNANEKLVAMGEFKETLTSMLVHDLKNPLSGIISVANSGKEKDKVVEHSAKLMLNLVMNILDVQKLQDDKIVLEKKEVALTFLVENAIAYVGFAAKQKNINILNQVDSKIRVLCDVSLIERVLINLLSNAVQYSPSNGEIRIFANSLDSEFIEVGVSDNGKGMSENKIEELLSNSNKIRRGEDKYSTGIGLQYVQLAIQAHGSTLEIQSVEGEGASFLFKLPLKIIDSHSGNPKNISLDKSTGLTRESVRVLKPVAKKLQGFQVYEGSKILKLLESIETEDSSCQEWIDQVKNALFTSNEAGFIELIQLVLNYES